MNPPLSRFQPGKMSKAILGEVGWMDINAVHVVREIFFWEGIYDFLVPISAFSIYFFSFWPCKFTYHVIKWRGKSMERVYLDGEKCTFCSINALQLNCSG